MHASKQSHLDAVFRIVKYLNSAPGKGFFFLLNMVIRLLRLKLMQIGMGLLSTRDQPLAIAHLLEVI